MCLAIPGKIVEIVDEENQIAKVEVGGVRRNVNIGMLDKDDARVGDYVLIHVGFAMSKVDEKEAEETLRLLEELGSYEEEMSQFKSSIQ
ncbi:MAG TPA: HypC/HybG/HupF family hydrogenase formation chaperone [Blastocatellia bacterium]|nr:HypC/HybG/HupF family hydrogenase formation chaperone [Blastocatellia bacterium]